MSKNAEKSDESFEKFDLGPIFSARPGKNSKFQVNIQVISKETAQKFKIS